MNAPPPSALPLGAAAVLDECGALVEGFAAAGRKLYLVGGIVRDLYAGAELDDVDLDFTTDATPVEVKSILDPFAQALWTQGERFGTIAAKISGRLVEITTHRAEAYDPGSRKPAVVFADDVRVDLSRRDFTINASAIELTSQHPQLIDPFDGVGDLRRGRLRTPLAPTESFSDDPLRMMRAARFVARLGVVPDPEVVDAMTSMSQRLTMVSIERVRVELDKLLGTVDPSTGLRLLLSTGLAATFLPELDEPAIAVAAAVRPDSRLRLAGLLAESGERMARRRAEALRCSRHDIDHIGTVVGLVAGLRGHGSEWTDAEVRRLAHSAGEAFEDVIEIVGAVEAVANGRQVELPPATLGSAVAALRATGDLDDLGAPLDGQQVMAQLDLGPGRDIGDALQFLTDLRLDEGPIETDAAVDRLRVWWAERSAGPRP